MARSFVQGLINFATARMVDLSIENLENIPTQGACIAASNHVGRMEVLLVYSVLQREDVIMLAAEKYRQSGLWRWVGKQLDVVWVDRFNADFQAVREVLKRLKAGGILTIAPEGTRSPDGTLQTARSGAAFLAAKAGVPIIPIGLDGTDDRLVAANLKRFRRSKVIARVGKPFTLPPLPAQEREAALERCTEEIMCQIAAMLPAERHGAYAGHPRLQELLAARSAASPNA